MPSQLSARGLSKRYGRYQAVKHVDLDIESGQIVGLLGPNGAGKTSSFYLIAGLLRPDGGSIRIDGQDITHAPMHQRARLGLGYLAQEASVFRQLSVIDNLLAVLELRPELDRHQRETQAEQLLQEFHLGGLRDKRGIELSGGERRRVEIARCLASAPRFILLDEPFAGVDPISVIDIQRIIEHLAERDIGILITDHNVRETLKICQYATILNDGEIIAQGSPEAILENPKVRQSYLGEGFSL